jgi:excisionase family DNA binding protein
LTRGTPVDERKRLAEEARDAQEGLPVEPLCVRISAAVKLTGIGRSTLYELINAGEIETVKIGRSTFILYRSLKRLILG